MLKFRTVCLVTLCFSFHLPAQTSMDMALIQNSINASHSTVAHTKHTSSLRHTSNPLKMTSFLLLFFYQKVISEQISAECEFDMSCSAFGVSAMKEFGIVKSIGLTADRLTRCNGIAQSETENHLINHTTGKVIDDPSMYRFNK